MGPWNILVYVPQQTVCFTCHELRKKCLSTQSLKTVWISRMLTIKLTGDQ